MMLSHIFSKGPTIPALRPFHRRGAKFVLSMTPLLLALSACATPETKLRAGLVDAGLSEPMAACMADYMVDRLSLTQLRRLQSLSTVKNVDYQRITMDQYLHRIRALKDPELMAVSGKAALHCAF